MRLTSILAALLLAASGPALGATRPIRRRPRTSACRARRRHRAVEGTQGAGGDDQLLATWCGPCRQEMPLLEQIYAKYEPLGFTLLGVNVKPTARPPRPGSRACP